MIVEQLLQGFAMAFQPLNLGFMAVGVTLGIIVGILAGIAEPGIPIASLLAHIIGGIFSGFAYKNFAWRFRDRKPLSLSLWALQVVVYYWVIVVPLFALGLVLFYPDPEYGGFLALMLSLEAYVIPEMILTVVVTTILMASLPERYRRPLW